MAHQGTVNKPKNAEQLEEMVKDLNDTIEQTYYLNQQIFKLDNTIKANKEKISKALGRKKQLSVRVDDNLSFTVFKSTKANIEFFREQLQANLDKEIYKKVINKKIVVHNFEGLVKMLKGYGVPPKHFKEFVKSEEEVDVEKIDQLVEIEELTLEDLQGCYSVNFDEEIRIRKNN